MIPERDELLSGEWAGLSDDVTNTTEPATTPMAGYLKDLSRTRLLTREEEIELALRIEKGDEAARKRMIESNLRLVISLAKRYSNRGLPLTDLVEEGNLGLMKAVERFRTAKGCRFSTYASWWIRQSLQRALMNQARTVRLPVHVVARIELMSRCAEVFNRRFGRYPTKEELGEQANLSPAYVEQLQSIRQKTLSMDEALDSDGEITLQDRVGDPGVEDPIDTIRFGEMRAFLVQRLSSLSERERSVLSLRFGLEGDEEGLTLQEVGLRFGLSRERIRQIEAEALEKLRGDVEADGVDMGNLI